jgi:hypothetical protein
MQNEAVRRGDGPFVIIAFMRLSTFFRRIRGNDVPVLHVSSKGTKIEARHGAWGKTMFKY